jgi:hypothetical protein
MTNAMSYTEWFSVYKVGQRVASTFTNEDETVFIAGDVRSRTALQKEIT